MFGSMTSLTGGGGLSSSSSSSADGDSAFDNAFSYKSGGNESNNTALIVLGVVALAVVVWGRK